MKSATVGTPQSLRAVVWLLFGVAAVIAIVARIRLLGLPLERDEGEYAYTGQLMLQGIAPYKLAYSMKLPGTAAMYAAFMFVFGQTAWGIHAGLLLVNLITVALIYVLGKQLLGSVSGAIAGATYAILSLLPYVLGQAAHATHFVIFWAAAGALVLNLAADRGSKPLTFVSGVVFGLGFLMKQPGLLFIFFGIAYIILSTWRSGLTRTLTAIAVFICGGILPFGVTCLILWNAGALPKLWFWTVQYAERYGTRLSLADAAQVFIAHFPNVMSTAWPLWAIAVCGLVVSLTFKKFRASRDFIALWTLFSVLAVCAGFYFRPHYFILALPAISLLTGVAVNGALEFAPNKLAAGSVAVSFFAILLFCPIWTEADFFFQRTLTQANRMVNGTNPFAESVRIGKYLREASDPTDTIAVLGSEPEIYFYSHRHSATGYIYTYGLMEPQQFARVMQQEMIREIESARPKFMVLVSINKSWLSSAESDQTIFRWAQAYCDANYDKVGLVNVNEGESDYYFATVPTDIKPGPEHILIYRRKG